MSNELLLRALANTSSSLGSLGFQQRPFPLEYFRTNLPDLDIDALGEWLRLYIHRPTSTSYLIQAIICSVCCLAVLIAGSVVLSYRLWTKSLWLFRIQDVRGTSLVIPNSTSTFVVLEAAYACVYLAAVWHNIAINAWGANPELVGYWNGVMWVPLFLGAWCGGWGTLFACPGILNRPKATARTDFDARALIPGPKMTNLIGILVPTAYTAAAVTMSVLTGKTYQDAVHQWNAWEEEAAIARLVGAGLTEELKDRAANVVKLVTDSWWYVGVDRLILVVFNWTFLIFYGVCGAILITTIHSRLRSMSSSLLAEEKAKGAFDNHAGPTALDKELPQWNSEEDAQRAADIDVTRAQKSMFFPPIAGGADTSLARPTMRSRASMLRSALINISFLCSAITFGCLGFAICCLWALLRVYRDAVRGPYELSRFYETEMLISSWLSSASGVTCFAAISLKTFEGVFEEWSASRNASTRAWNLATRPAQPTLSLPSSVRLRLRSPLTIIKDLPLQSPDRDTALELESTQYFPTSRSASDETSSPNVGGAGDTVLETTYTERGSPSRLTAISSRPRARSFNTAYLNGPNLPSLDAEFTSLQRQSSDLTYWSPSALIQELPPEPAFTRGLARPQEGSSARLPTRERAHSRSSALGLQLCDAHPLPTPRASHQYETESVWRIKFETLRNADVRPASSRSMRRSQEQSRARMSREEVRQTYLDDDPIEGSDDEDGQEARRGAAAGPAKDDDEEALASTDAEESGVENVSTDCADHWSTPRRSGSTSASRSRSRSMNKHRR